MNIQLMIQFWSFNQIFLQHGHIKNIKFALFSFLVFCYLLMINFLPLSFFIFNHVDGYSVWGILSLYSSYFISHLVIYGVYFVFISFTAFHNGAYFFLFILVIISAFSIFSSLSRSLSVPLLVVPISMLILFISVSILVFGSSFLIPLSFLFSIFKLKQLIYKFYLSALYFSFSLFLVLSLFYQLFLY